MQEIFKDIPGYEKRYQISNLGRVKSLAKQKGFGIGYLQEEKILKSGDNTWGYLQVTLFKNKKVKKCTIHRLVLLSFVGKSKLECNHKNGIKTDNRLKNLEYCTKSENHIHAFKLGLMDKKGEKHHLSKLINKNIIEIRKLYKNGNYTQQKLANIYNVDRRTIGDVINKKTWKHI